MPGHANTVLRILTQANRESETTEERVMKDGGRDRQTERRGQRQTGRKEVRTDRRSTESVAQTRETNAPVGKGERSMAHRIVDRANTVYLSHA